MYFESVAVSEGSNGRLHGPSPGELRLDLAAATAQGACVLYYILGGDVRLTHVRRRSSQEPGSIVTFDGTLPASIKANGQSPYDIMTIEVPAARLAAPRRPQGAAGGLGRIRETHASPLTACIKVLAEHMQTATKDELTALYEACVSLLVAEEARFETAGATSTSPLLRAMLDHINRNICDPTLAPATVARGFGISVRYLHKLFAASGMTFRAYVVMRRLDGVRNALLAGGAATRTIAELAQAWGFRDVSAFNRTFRKRFGCAPRRLRTRTAS